MARGSGLAAKRPAVRDRRVSDLYRRAKELFLEAIEQPAEERDEFVEKTCAGDEALLARVRELMASDRPEDSLLDRKAADLIGNETLTEQLRRDDPDDGPQTEMGPYRLMRKIGEGGMGEVWLAEQTVPVKRQVAIKVIKQGMDTKQVVSRFQAERQAVAMMEHPSIAKVYEANATPRGRPYFAMEYVDGVPITKHCDRELMNSRERLELFVAVCDGVQHAHQKAVIHRDIKPSNVLVAKHDGQALPKIIDFGVAKATRDKLSLDTFQTQQGILIGTPAYMSPEQADLVGSGVDTRTDVYSLGVMLYELLVGALPFDTQELQKDGIEEMLRKIREDEPSRPSAKLSTLGEHSTESARRRSTALPALQRELSGDLDWITLKAMSKDRAQRYGSPQELAADIRRYLNNEAVLAAPPSMAYLAGKFVRRHRLGVALAAGGVLVIAAFAVMMTVSAGRVANERDRANREAESKGQVADFLKNLFAVTDPGEERANSITARELLDAGAEKIEQLDDELTRADLAEIMGDVYKNLGLFDASEPLLDRAFEIRRRVQGAEHPRTIHLMGDLGWLYWEQSRYPEAKELLLETIEISSRALGKEDLQTVNAMGQLAVVYRRMGEMELAEETNLYVLEVRKRVRGADAPSTLATMTNLGNLYKNLARYDEAEALYLKVLEAEKRTLGEDHPSTLTTRRMLGALYMDLKRYDDAEAIVSEAVSAFDRRLGEDHPDTLDARSSLGLIYVNQERYSEAERIFAETLEKSRRVRGEEHSATLLIMGNLALARLRLDRADEALALYKETLAIQQRTLGMKHPETAIALFHLANISRDNDHFDESVDYYEQVIAIDSSSLGAEHPYVADDLEEYAKLRRKMGETAQADELQARADAIRAARD